ncbi:hypothetical protein BEL04_14665 [Mucilaginibacter sp. PPCGB 2223]|uniref:hypothetical protein n=1 Tax=Mucilaginibacter sp. PPCGB 2223 TaxID=1886027 RepID=UPI000825CDEA|nr:hypothetical protein [Mucilaginibacter sp. PPCGB 2223]OCX52686.1 hypothetical protein BEL04_14665 [Mucilaginibacter sp. PPCGB 2223]
MNKYLNTLLLLPLLIIGQLHVKPAADVVNYYGTPTDIIFNNTKFTLTWSSHPNDTYYKQEYITHGDAVEHFKDMVLVDFIITDLTVKDAAQAQVNNILERKKTDKVCNYQIIKNEQTGEYILDFIMSESTGDDLSVIEWSGYHYKPYTDKAGHKGVLLFGISHRAYGDDTMNFLKTLKTYRGDVLKALVAYQVPEIQIQ